MGNVYVHRVKWVVFLMFGGLGGDFCKDTYEAKLFEMHIGSVLSGLHARNVNTDAKISIVGYRDVWRGVKKKTIFRFLETLEGTFVRQHMSKCSELFMCRKCVHRPRHVTVAVWGWGSVRA